MTATTEGRADADRAARLREAIRKKRQARAPRSRAETGTPEIPPRPPDEPALLGPMQRSLWLAHRLDPDSAAYHLVDAYRIKGRLDIEALEHEFRQVVRRHRLLRSTFHPSVDEAADAIQTVIPAERVDEFFRVEVIRAAGGGPDEDADTVAVREARRPFDLSKPPLVRLLVIRDEILMLVLHHILADEHALGVFWREISVSWRETSRAFAGGQPSPPLREEISPLQYDDYAHWARRRDPKARRQEVEAWRRRLDPIPDELALPFETRSFEAGTLESGSPPMHRSGRLLSRLLPTEIADGVRALARHSGATPFLVLAFAYRLLLDRYSEGEMEGRRVAFASPASTRFHAQTAEMIGYFTNPVVMPTAVDESSPVGEALRRFRSDALERLGQAGQVSVPFQELVEALVPPRRDGRHPNFQHPIFQTMFVLRRPGPPPDLGVGLDALTLDLGVAKFDLTIFVIEGRNGYELAVEYRADRYVEAGVRRFLAHYEALLAALPEALGQSVAEISLLNSEEVARVESFARGPALTTELELLPRRLRAVSVQAADSPAIVFEGQTTSYGELAETASRIAHRLAESGLGREGVQGERVGLFLGRSAELVAAVAGCFWAGAAYVPLDPTYPADRNRDVLHDAEVAAVLVAGARETERTSGGLAEGPWTMVRLDELGDASPTALVEPRPETPAYLVYTSGSSGRPKGVVVSHESLRLSTAARLQAYGDLGVRPGRFLLLPSLAFDSSVAGLFWTLSVGDALVLPTDDEARDPRMLAALIERERVTNLLCVPSLYAQILRFAREADLAEPLRSLEAVIVAGESCPWSLVSEHFEALPDVRLFNEYGPTEATVWATLHEITLDEMSRVSKAEPVSIGTPIPGLRIDVEDARGRPVPVGVPGQAWIAGPTVTGGYRGRPDLTRERFQDLPDGTRRYRTGDRMAWTDDGRLLFLGREDEQIKLRGFRIEPGEIESALLDLEWVERAAVVARLVGDVQAAGSERLVAFVEGRPPEDWRERLARRLPTHMVPSRLAALPELPTLPNGKVDRRRLREMPMPERVPSPRRAAQPGDEVVGLREQALLSLWQGLLGLPGIGLDDNFFELGGHSLQVAEMALAIERDFGVRLTAADVFENPTVRRLARRITDGGTNAEPYEHLFPIQPSGRGAPCLVCVPHFFSGLFAERFRGERPVYGLRGVSLRQEGNLGRWPTMRHLADDLVQEVERRFPRPLGDPSGDGFLVAGYSFGGSMAVEMVRVMEMRGIPVRGLYLIAPMPLDFVSMGPLRAQLRPLTQPAADLGPGAVLGIWLRDHDPRTLRPYRYAWRWLKVQPLRRLRCLIGRFRRGLGLPLSRAILHADVRVDRFRLHKNYRPGCVETPTVIFNPDENAEIPGTDSAATWAPVFRSLHIVTTPDPHRDEAAVEAAKRILLDQLKDLGDA